MIGCMIGLLKSNDASSSAIAQNLGGLLEFFRESLDRRNDAEVISAAKQQSAAWDYKAPSRAEILPSCVPTLLQVNQCLIELFAFEGRGVGMGLDRGRCGLKPIGAPWKDRDASGFLRAFPAPEFKQPRRAEDVRVVQECFGVMSVRHWRRSFHPGWNR